MSTKFQLGETRARIDMTNKRFAESLTKKLAAATPIKTGQAMSNWRMSSRRARYKFVEFKGGKVISRSEALRAVSLQVDRVKTTRSGHYYITNAVPYVTGDINKNHKTKAGFIQATIEKHTMTYGV